MKKRIMLLIIILLILLMVFLIFIIKDNKLKNENKDEYLYAAQKPSEEYSELKEKYMYNEFQFASVSIEDLVKIYFNNYRAECNNNIENSYKMLNDEYRDKKFGDFENYKKYIDENIDKINNITLEQYSKTQTAEGYNKYTCTDKNGNNYIFIEISIMDYSVMLDTYTLPSQEFVNKYNQTNEQGKTALNIQRIEKALNIGGYDFAYNCLSEGFKNNYFQTQEDFENYVKTNLFDGNFTVEYGKFATESGLFKYTVVLTNKGNPQESIEKTIIMKLNEGTDFEMSFNV